ncbi:hydrogenase maturation protease, partial [Oharaeibacter diazotrophicus]
MTAVLVLAWGNRSRGDDALGPVVLDRLAATARPGVTLVEDYQLQLEHALDVAAADLVLFVDAGHGTPAPFSFAEVPADDDPASPFSHALAPAALLGVCRRVGAKVPAAFVLAIRGEEFGLGTPLSAAAAARADAAAGFA